LRIVPRRLTTATIIGASTMTQLRTAVASIDIGISPELEERIDSIHQRQMNPSP
jgi:aryl-alcohol dehydrogenase-like predicted oxidoreductase